MAGMMRWTRVLCGAGCLVAASIADAGMKGVDETPMAFPQYADVGEQQDVIFDAPWYLTPGRTTVPLLVFVPEVYWKQSRNYGAKLVEFVVVNPAGAEWGVPDRNWFLKQRIVYRDTDADPLKDRMAVRSLVPAIKNENGDQVPVGEIERGIVGVDPILTPGWHRILQIPVGLLKEREGHFYLAAYAEERRAVMKGGKVVTIEDHAVWAKMLRVKVGKHGLPMLDPKENHQFDPHFHTMCEYTTRGGLMDGKAPKQAFSGPWQMAVDCAYALGMTDSDDRRRVANQITSTDHSWEYSDTDFPEVGPFRALVDAGISNQGVDAAGQAEYDLLRSFFGTETGGQETHMNRSRLISWDEKLFPVIAAAHTLVYQHPHPFHCTWDGGDGNPQTVETVMTSLRDLGGFTFGAHPYHQGSNIATSMNWLPEYFDRGIQWPPYNSRSLTRPNEFVVKGFQIWNERLAYTADGFSSDRFLRMNPFAATYRMSYIGRSGKSVRTVEFPAWDKNFAWHKEFGRGQIAFHEHITRGLEYSFAEQRDRRFIRKLYWLAATDAHGDFNYGTGHTSSWLEEYIPIANGPWLASNAFGRARTYVFGRTIEALKHGWAVITDGPVVEATLDTDLRFECPAPGEAGEYRWHDRWERVERTQPPSPDPKRPSGAAWRIVRVHAPPIPLSDRYFTADGKIGGAGVFDGGHTLLTLNGNPYSVLRYRWTGNRDFGGDVNRIELYKDQVGKAVLRRADPGAEGVEISERDAALPVCGDHEWTYIRFGDVKPDPGIRGARGTIARPPIVANSALSLAGFTSPGEAGRYGPDDARCFANPIWASPVHIKLVDPNAPYGYSRYEPPPDAASVPNASWEPPHVAATFWFALSMDDTRHPVIRARQLDAEGESSGPPQQILPGHWEASPAGFSSAGYLDASAVLSVQTGPRWWYNTATKTADPGYVSFVVYMEDPTDFHGNRLNAIAKAFTTTLRKRAGQQKSAAYSYRIDLQPGQSKIVRIPTFCVDPHTPCFTLAPLERGAVGSKRDAMPILLIPPGGSSTGLGAVGDRAKVLDAARREAAAGKPVDLGIALEAGLARADARPVGQWLGEPAVVTNLAPHVLALVVPVGAVLTPMQTTVGPEFQLDLHGKRDAIEVALAAQDLAARGGLEPAADGRLRRALPKDRFRQIVTQWATWYVVNHETPEAMRDALARTFPEEFAKLKDDPQALSEAARELWALVEKILARREALAKAAGAGTFKWTSIDPWAAVTMGAEDGVKKTRAAVETR